MNFIDYIESHVDYKYVSGGLQIQVLECPFCGHSAKDNRTYVGVKTKLGYCHHCSTGFNGVKFVSKFEGVSFKKAIDILNDEEGFASYDKEYEEEIISVETPKTISISESEEASEYLSDRGIDSALIEHFNLSYCVKNISVEIEGYSKTYSTKRRILIPIFDLDGNMLSWQARDCSGLAKNKYLFPPQFKSNEYLYNCHSINKDADYMIVCEGVFDVFGWFKCGFQNAVATFGKKISSAQIDIVKMVNPKTIYIAWDNDAFGAKYGFCEKYGYLFNDIKIVELPNGKDADECSVSELTEAIRCSSNYDWTKKILGLL